MASHKKYNKHKETPNRDRKNGKSWKQHPQVFDPVKRRLVPATPR